MINVRPPQLQDAVGIAVAHSRLWLANFGQYLSQEEQTPFNESTLAGQWHDLLVEDTQGRRVVIAVEWGRVVGIAMTVPTVRNTGAVPPARARELTMHYLDKEFQGQGLGLRLLEYVCEPTEPMQLWVPQGYAGEARAYQIYRRAGFGTDGAVTGRDPSYGLPLMRMVR
ncbi:MAG: GNAT family N-acetyltransferase [Actinomycetaceae bacterium]|nr:GNAT family N-acetyltransferase [Actinomycetaceae bacterium]